MKFLVTNRVGIEKGLSVESQYVVISIHDPGKPPARIPQQPGLQDSLVLAFHDVEPLPIFGFPPGFHLMTPAQAGQIREFFEKHNGTVETLVVHCEMGISRSPAVAAALCRVSGEDDGHFWREYEPNRFVYKQVLQAFNKSPGQAGASALP